jgi:putative PIN family toxin of toxin-antitoxin system
VTQALCSPLIVLDTNIVLDLFIFSDPRCNALKLALNKKRVQWISTQVMRDELERVLAYTHLQPRMAFYSVTASDVLQQFDTAAQLHEIAPRAAYVCKDADDQKFIDLAVQHRCALISKDKAVLTMRKRLASLNVAVAVQWADTAVLGG